MGFITLRKASRGYLGGVGGDGLGGVIVVKELKGKITQVEKLTGTVTQVQKLTGTIKLLTKLTGVIKNDGDS